MTENVGQALEGLEHAVERFVTQSGTALELPHFGIVVGVVGEAEEVGVPRIATIRDALLSKPFEFATKPFLLEDFDIIVGAYITTERATALAAITSPRFVPFPTYQPRTDRSSKLAYFQRATGQSHS